MITHYDQTASTPTTDPVQAASRSELKTKLEETLAGFKEKTAKLTAEMGVEEKKASGKVFETDDPDKNRYVVSLSVGTDGPRLVNGQGLMSSTNYGRH